MVGVIILVSDEMPSYDNIYDQHAREAAQEIVMRSMYKCELLKTKGDHFRFCTIGNPDEDSAISPTSPIVQAMRIGEILRMYCHSEHKCTEFHERIGKIQEADEFALETICRDKGVEYIPIEEQKISSMAEMRGEYARILGRNYPVKEFEDRRGIRRMPYTIRYGRELPIICSASLVVRETSGTEKTYLLMQESNSPKKSGNKRKDSGKFDIPGGAVEEGESFETCAKREFEEEIERTAEIHKLVGVFEKINQNNRLVWKAVYAGSMTPEMPLPPDEKRPGEGSRPDDASGFAFFGLGAIRMLYKNNLIKTPDIMLIMNRIEQQMVEFRPDSGRECVIRLGWE